MTTKSARFPLATIIAAACAGLSARADPGAVIARARAYLGTDDQLNAVRSVHYTGTLVTAGDPATGAKPSEAVVEIVFQKPYRERIMATSDKGIEVTALDNYDAWHRVQDPKDPTRWQLSLLSGDQIKTLRANTWENLAFYRGIDLIGGSVEDLGAANVDGVACDKLAFHHDKTIVFYRYFDQATGRLVLTETGVGGTIREEGEMIVNGIRFPKKVTTTTKQAGAKDRSVTVNFDKIVVNETVADSLFEIPSLAPASTPEAAPFASSVSTMAPAAPAAPPAAGAAPAAPGKADPAAK